MSNGSTSNLFLLYLTVDGVPVPDAWDKKGGGDVTPQITKYRPGGAPNQVALSGPTDVGDVTLTRLFVKERDHDLMKHLMTRAGKATCVVTQQPIDPDYQPWGAPLTYTGRLGKVSPPDVDSNSQSASTWEIDVATQGVPS